MTSHGAVLDLPDLAKNLCVSDSSPLPPRDSRAQRCISTGRFIAKCYNTAILPLLVWDLSACSPDLVVRTNLSKLSEANSSSQLRYTGILFGDEIKYIWTREWSLFSLLWFLVRWLSDVLAANPHLSCRAVEIPHHNGASLQHGCIFI